MINGLEDLPYAEKLEQFGLFILEKRKLSGDFVTVLQCLKGSYKRTEALPSQGASGSEQGTMSTSCTGRGFVLL